MSASPPQGPEQTIRKTCLRISPKTSLANITGSNGPSRETPRWCWRTRKPPNRSCSLLTISNIRAGQTCPARTSLTFQTMPANPQPRSPSRAPLQGGARRSRVEPDAPWWSQTLHGGARRDRTDDLKLAKLALSQLSYGPFWSELGERKAARQAAQTAPTMVGLGRLERPTSPLSGVRSNHLSYRPGSTVATARPRQESQRPGRALSGRRREETKTAAFRLWVP